MDDMRLLKELGEGTPLPNSPELEPARRKLLVETRTPSHTRRNWRFGWAGWATVGVATAVAGVLVVGQVVRTDDRTPTDGPRELAVQNAAQVLHLAAEAALRVPDVTPRGDQFVYVKTQTGKTVREVWRSVDGTRQGLIEQQGEAPAPLPGCENGRAVVVKGSKAVPGQAEPCTPDPAYHADLPTDADSMLAYLNKNHSGAAGDVNALGKDVLALAQESYLRPKSRAALFEAAARIPGLQVVRSVKDAAGRPGIGVTWPSPKGSQAGRDGEQLPGSGKVAQPHASSPDGGSVLVFDEKTYTLLGVADSSAVLQIAIVDQVQQRP